MNEYALPSAASLRRTVFLAVLTALPCIAEALPADEDATPAGPTAEMLVETTRDREAGPELPGTQSSVTSKTLATAVNLHDVEEGLKYLPGLEVRQRYVGDRSSPVGSRTSGGIGLSARALVYADGLLLANLLGNDNNDYTPRWGMVAPEELERIDVLYGPYSALYAGNSMGSVVKMVTRLPERFEAHAKLQYFSQQFDAYATNDRFDGRQVQAMLGDRVGPVAAWLSLNHLSSLGQPIAFATVTSVATSGPATNTGAIGETDQYGVQRYITGATSIDDTRQDTGKLKFAYDFGNRLRLLYTLGYWHTRSDIGYDSYLRDAAGRPVYGGTVNVGGGRRITVPATSFGLQAQALDHLLHGLELTGAREDFAWRITGSTYDYLTDARRKQSATTGAAGTLTTFDGTRWRTLDAQSTWSPGGQAIGHQLTFGIHFDQYVLKSGVYAVADWLDSTTGTRASAFGGRTRTVAQYLQDAWGVAPGWLVTLGLRAEQWSADKGVVAGATAEQSFPARNGRFLSPKAALRWQATTDWTLTLSTGMAYRLPTVAELFQGSIPNSANTVTYNNPGLRPEQVLAANFDAERRFRSTLGNGWLRGTVFFERNRDALLKQPIPPTDPNYTAATGATTSYWSNIDEVRSEGVEAAGHVEDFLVPRLGIDGSLTYAHSLVTRDSAQPDIEGSWQNRVPKWRAKMTLQYEPAANWTVSASGRYSGLQRNGYPNADVRPNTYLGFAPYLVFDARATWKPLPSFTVAGGIDNIANRLYYQFHPYSGRTFTLELRVDR